MTKNAAAVEKDSIHRSVVLGVIVDRLKMLMLNFVNRSRNVRSNDYEQQYKYSFLLQKCKVMFFAVDNQPDSLDKDTRKDISKYLSRGHGMLTVPHETVKADFASKECCDDCG